MASRPRSFTKSVLGSVQCFVFENAFQLVKKDFDKLKSL